MTHHRCTGCKQESNPRHKWMGGVYCDTCIRGIRGYRPDSVRRGLFAGIWDMVTGFIDRVFYHKHTVKLEAREVEKKIHTQMKVMQARARDIPPNPQGGTPGKH